MSSEVTTVVISKKFSKKLEEQYKTDFFNALKCFKEDYFINEINSLTLFSAGYEVYESYKDSNIFNFINTLNLTRFEDTDYAGTFYFVRLSEVLEKIDALNDKNFNENFPHLIEKITKYYESNSFEYLMFCIS